MSPPTSAAAPPLPDLPPVPAPPTVQRARALSLALLVGLIVLCLAWELWLAPTGSGTLAIKALPLLACLLGLLRHRLYTYRWLSLLLWLYVTEGLVRSTSERGLPQQLAVAEVVLATLLFVLCVHYIRLRVPRKPRAAR
ncbi:MAG: DUF2069 domain-containing protein [Rubrivivax sp.]|jgi:uncharacterized membrane protein|nr:DUF2069 domain-containing protein [Rubrivivax sp.]MBK8526745.1 DUF2069 domain-containing protein [Rubrivivax sp.]